MRQFFHKLVKQVKQPAPHRQREVAKPERDKEKDSVQDEGSLSVVLPRTFDNTGLYPRDLATDLRRSDSFDILPTNGRMLQDGTIDSKFEYALRRAVKDAFDFFRDNVRWDEKTRTHAVMRNFERNGFAKITCVLCSEPIWADLDYLYGVIITSGGDPDKMPLWENETVEVNKYDEDLQVKDKVSRDISFDHKGPRANVNDEVAPAGTSDTDDRFNYRASALMVHDRWLINDRQLQAEALLFAREMVKRNPCMTLRDVSKNVFEAFEKDMTRLYNHPVAVGVADRKCNSEDGREYDRLRNRRSQEEVLGEWRLAERLRNRTELLRR